MANYPNENVIDTKIILKGLMSDQDYLVKVLDSLKSDYFNSKPETVAFDAIRRNMEEYGSLTSSSDLELAFESARVFNEAEKREAEIILKDIKRLKIDGQYNTQYLIDKTEDFIAGRLIHEEFIKYVKMQSGEKTAPIDPSKVEAALTFKFDDNLGSGVFSNLDDLWELNNVENSRITYGITTLDEVTGGGMARQSLSAFLGGTGGGKSMTMVHVAANAVMKGYNVAYVTMEMNEKDILNRIHANMLKSALGSFEKLPKEVYVKRLSSVYRNGMGELYVKQFGLGTNTALHFKKYLKELNAKKGFKPDLVIVDYIGICDVSQQNDNLDSNNRGKRIAEELRQLSRDFDVAVLTASQVNRAGIGSNTSGFDLEIGHTRDSVGIVETLDFYCAIGADDEMRDADIMAFKQLKNRSFDLGYKTKFTYGINRAQMRYFEIDENGMPVDDISTPKNLGSSNSRRIDFDFDE